MSTLMKKRMRSKWSVVPYARKKTRTAGYKRTTGYYGRYPPLGQELKFLDTSGNQAGVSNSGVILEDSLVEVAAGTGESQRIGRKLTVKSLHINFVASLVNTTSVSSTDDGLRVILYHDKQCNGATAAVTDILETADYLSFNNLANKNRFTILMDRKIDISATAGSYNGTTSQFGAKALTKSFHKKLNVPVEFSSTTGGITEIRSNNIGLMAISDAAQIGITYTVRVRYADS